MIKPLRLALLAFILVLAGCAKAEFTGPDVVPTQIHEAACYYMATYEGVECGDLPPAPVVYDAMPEDEDGVILLGAYFEVFEVILVNTLGDNPYLTMFHETVHYISDKTGHEDGLSACEDEATARRAVAWLLNVEYNTEWMMLYPECWGPRGHI